MLIINSSCSYKQLFNCLVKVTSLGISDKRISGSAEPKEKISVFAGTLILISDNKQHLASLIKMVLRE